jgi:hypothetical protein
MKHVSFIFLALIGSLVSSPLQAADGPPPSRQKQEILRITLHPMAETRPALKYRLLPPLSERRPGNAAVWWNQLLSYNGGLLAELDKRETRDRIEKWMAIPIGDPREQAFRAKEPIVDKLIVDKAAENDLFAKLDYAARFDSCDWEFPWGNWDILNPMVTEIRVRRSWGLLLAAKAHREIADKKYDDALHSVQTGLALARHLGQSRRFLSAALGTQIATFIADQVEQFVQQPDAPNLYWSLVMLPEPLIDYHASYETEMNNLYFGLPYLQDLEKRSLGKEQWDDLLARLLADLSKSHIDVPSARLAEGYARAKKYLIGHGRMQAEVEAMPQSQVILLFTVSLYQELSDERYKLWFLHYGEAAAEYQRQDAKLREDLQQEIIPLAAAGQLAFVDLKRVETRIPFIIARLRIFEALRIYAAGHDGHLPQQLADIREVPIPLNPYNDKPFAYSCDGDRVLLSAESGRSDGPWRCEITMTSKAK